MEWNLLIAARRLIVMRRLVTLVLVMAIFATGCGEGNGSAVTSTVPPSQSTAATMATTTITTEPETQVYGATGIVLDKEGVGPQLCSGVLDSLPPQCRGLPVVGFEWADVPWAETAGDTTWAEARVVGLFDGAALILTEPASEPDGRTRLVEDPDFSSPCPEPEGGWVVRDDVTATEETFEQARLYAEAVPGFAGLWVDNLQAVPDERTYGPGSYVANFSFTSDLDVHRTALEEIYGGPMCVSEGLRPLAELRDLQSEVFDAIFTPQAEAAGIYAGYGASGSANQFAGVVEVSVMVAAGDSAQAWLDDQFGPGTVVIYSFLQPYDGS